MSKIDIHTVWGLRKGFFRHVPDLERHNCKYPTPSTLREK